ncbi:DUF1566 domain-containing protein [Thermodesulfobacteriota bacterium B35]
MRKTRGLSCLLACLFFIPVLVAAMAGPASGAGTRDTGKQRFVDNRDGTVTDTSTGLMWAASDNGADIQWWDADRYCREYRGGGYTDWRLPTPDELAGLYDPVRKEQGGLGIVSAIRLTERCPWSSTTNLNAAVCFSFATGRQSWARRNDSYELRVLPVRGPEAAPRRDRR